MRRWTEQRWLLDAAISAQGLDWDQGRTRYLARACSGRADGDLRSINARVHRFSDIEPEFRRAAERRQERAESAVAHGHYVSAREDFFVASILWGAAEWPIFDNNEAHAHYNASKVQCYEQYRKVASSVVERVSIPFGTSELAGHLHLPNDASSHPVACVLTIGGMDSFKEMMSPLQGDPFVERGMAHLALDGPGQGESLMRGIYVTQRGHVEAAAAAVDWLARQPRIDSERIGLHGVSFGSFWATQIASALPRFAACAVSGACFEPGHKLLFESASPTFKRRFMYMSGIADESEFNRFAASLVLRDVDRIRCPYLALVGSVDELSPLEHAALLFGQLECSKELVIYEGERHSIGGGAAALNGPDRHSLLADWLADRFAGVPAQSRKLTIRQDGHISEDPLS